MAKPLNPFDQFLTKEKTVFIEALGADVTFRELTMGETDAFNKRLLKDYDGKGDPTIDLAEATKINYEKVELSVVTPEGITVKYLQSLGSTATKAVNELVKAIDGREDEVDEEGNSED